MSRVHCLFSLMVSFAGLALSAATASAQEYDTGNRYGPGVDTRPYNAATLGRGNERLPEDLPRTPGVVPTGRIPYRGIEGHAGYGYGYGGYGGNYSPYGMSRYGSALQGRAALTASTGDYYVSTQQAALLREQARQANIVTQKQQLTFEMQYEDLKYQRGLQRIANEKQAFLDRARRDPSDVEIWSGKTFNILFQSILSSRGPTRGPDIPLNQWTLGGLNLTDGASKGSLALAKDEGKINWTDAFEDPSFDEVRKRFSANFAIAMKMAQKGEKPSRSAISDLKNDLKSLDDGLEAQVDTLSPAAYIESRRIIKKLTAGVAGLSNSHVIQSCNDTWKKDIRTVADLVAYCQKKGLQFGPAAAEDDRPRYQSAYYAIRSYERGVMQLASAGQ